MSIKTLSLSIFLVLIFLFIPCSTYARSIITGQVVDAETGQPIKNAAVYIYWYKYTGVPGLTSGKSVETAEDITDNEGHFKIPIYSTFFKEYRMTIYKKGYVCWSSDKIFPTWEDRKDFKLKNKMVIKLEKFKEEYSREEHARFINSSKIGTGTSSGVFDDATRQEREFLRKIYKRNKGE